MNGLSRAVCLNWARTVPTGGKDGRPSSLPPSFYSIFPSFLAIILPYFFFKDPYFIMLLLLFNGRLIKVLYIHDFMYQLSSRRP